MAFRGFGVPIPLFHIIIVRHNVADCNLKCLKTFLSIKFVALLTEDMSEVVA